MANRFPEEPYPVITDWPGIDNHNEGEYRCYHYSLTLAQVRHNADIAAANATHSDVDITLFLSGLGLAALPASLGIGICANLVSSFLTTIRYTSKDAQSNLFKTWEKIGDHMSDYNYQRVTISQVLKLVSRRNENTGIRELYWSPVDFFPRVPLEKYYLKD